jgi:hypothetical protein
MKLPVTILAPLCGLICLFDSAAAFVEYSVAKHNYGDLSSADILRRSSFYQTLDNNKTHGAYYASVQIGTPAQIVNLTLSTGSSDVWVIDASAPVCATSADICLTPCKLSSVPDFVNTVFKCIGSATDVMVMDSQF